jgi:osmoprotectant transport system substrate-binding protein
MKNRTKLIRVVPVVLTLSLLVACGNVGQGGQASDQGGGGGPTITVGSKNFTEQFVLGELYAQALEAHGFNVVKKLNLGSEQIADKALQNGQIDLYPEYTGTALAAILNYPGNPADLNSVQETYQKAKELYAKREPADTMLPPAPFNNSYGIFVRKPVAEQKHLTTLADLAKASPGLTFVSFSEFQNRPDGYPNMKKNYPAFDFGQIRIVNELGLRYQGVQQDKGDVGVGFTTDGQLTSDQLVVMKDPKSIWPYYNPAPVVRTDVLKKYPKMAKVLNSVSQSLSLQTMRELNGKVDLQQEDPEDVARQFLQKKGLV